MGNLAFAEKKKYIIIFLKHRLQWKHIVLFC